MKGKGGILLKKQSNLSRLLMIAGSYRYLTYASWILSAISALIALVPYYFIWQVMREVLEVAPNFSRAQNLTHNGWMAVLFAVIAVLVYIAGLMCSHLGAFRIATNLRLQSAAFYSDMFFSGFPHGRKHRQRHGKF